MEEFLMADTLPQPPLKNQRSEDFSEVYANNVTFEISAWDLKIIFGQLDQAIGVIEQHTAITVPWALAKLALYHLRSQILAREMFWGPIRLTDDMLPTEPVPPAKELSENPRFVALYEAAKKLREEYIAEVKEQQGS
jgi:hypothetical protein